MPALSMVLIQDVNSEGGAQFCNEIGNLICLRRLSDKELSKIVNLILKSHGFLNMYATCSELPSNLNTMELRVSYLL